MTSEENLLTGVLALIVVGGLFSILIGGWLGASILGACVGFAGGGGKLAFDSILQRDAPDANRGRAFARFETRFQVMWVVGALVPVAFDLDASTGFFMIFVTAIIALGSYVLARLSYAHRTGARQTIATARAASIEGKMSEVSAEVKGRLARGPRRVLGRMRRSGEVDDEYEYEESPDEWVEDEYVEGVYGDEYEFTDHGYVDDPDHDPDYDDSEYDDPDYDEEDQPVWADSTVADAAPHRPTKPASLAGSSPVAWVPDDEEFPWEPPPEGAEHRSAYLDDLDPSVDNPYPWSPDDPTRPDR